MDFWRKKKEDAVEAEQVEAAAGQESVAAGRRSTAVALRPIPEDALILIPLRNAVLFPGVISPITIGRSSSIAASTEAARQSLKVGFVLQRDPKTDHVGPQDLHRVGTAGQVVRYAGQAGGANHLMVQGERRFRVLEFLEGWPFLVASVAWIPEAGATADARGADVEARFLQLKTQAGEAITLLPNAPEELGEVVRAIESPSQLADMIANLLDISNEEKQDLLETFDLAARMDKVLVYLGKRVEIMRLSKEIGDKTRKEFDERQREHVLREQMRQIQKELGDDETDTAAETEALKKAIDEAGFPEDVLKHVRKEFKRLSRMGEQSAESSMLRTWLEWMTELPWKAEPQKAIDIAEARKVLDEDHHGLDKIKRRILEYLAVRKLNPEGKSPILCFVGPPGVGKTSLGQSIARAIDRKFQRVALGGTHDEAEIRGHRRTYIGAMPGNIITAVKRAGSRSGVLMLDEIDKLGAGGFHGDPSSALLEVLDPEQNSKFRDNYLGQDFDLSRVMFIATANQLDTIPGPLRDRMEIIQLPGYTEEEKLEIAKKYLVKRQLESNGLTSIQLHMTEEAIRALIADYTREAGVRSLERSIGAVFRHAAMKIAEGAAQVTVAENDLHAILGAKKFENELALRTSTPGVATGLAWTPVGGDILFIEASKVPGKGKLILTGQLGDVMKESAQAALTLAKNTLGRALDDIDIHVHVPAGATPKDGPSAGVAMYLSLISLLTDKPIRADVAMTGEISLRGLVMPIGGLKEKSLAALRAGIKTVMIPKRNAKDLEDIPADAKAKLEFITLERVEDAVRVAIGELPDFAHRQAA